MTSITSLAGEDVAQVVARARTGEARRVIVDNQPIEIRVPFPSPEDWRDRWIYFLLVDRFSNPSGAPRHSPWDAPIDKFQGGTYSGIQQQLGYLRDLGVGALWLSPVLKNCQYDDTYHGYGIQDFLRAEPRFATDRTRADDELQSLIDTAHGYGLQVILDIVLHHTGDVFAYVLDDRNAVSIADWRSQRYPVQWRNADGTPNPAWTDAPASPPPDAAVFPDELRSNSWFNQQGNAFSASAASPTVGDFFTLKELNTDALTPEGRRPVWDTLSRSYQYVVARFDVDGFRVDTVKYLSPGFARTFANAMREFALSISKRNFLIFGEVYGSEEDIAHFVGRDASDIGDPVGLDSDLDYPLFYTLPWVAKGLAPPSRLASVFEHRKQVERGLLSTHGDASELFVTFLDNHDQNQRFRYVPPDGSRRFDAQVSLAVACLFGLQGIPCLYYGTEQGLHGAGNSPEAAREALWGKVNAFDTTTGFYRDIRLIANARAAEPALRYGRQYFRPISGDGRTFGISGTSPGVVAFSRILADREVVVVANANPDQPWSGSIIVDRDLNASGMQFEIVYSNQPAPVAPGLTSDTLDGQTTIYELNGSVTHGPARVLNVHLGTLEVQILALGDKTSHG